MLRTPTVSALLGLALFSCSPAAAPEAQVPRPAESLSRRELPVPAPRIAAKAGKSSKTRSLDELLASADGSVLVHPIDPRAHNVVNGWRGTVLTLPPNSLVLADGSEPAGPVTITLREFYTPADMIGARISTVSFGRLLETAGAVLVEARAADADCQLRPGVLVDLEFPFEEKLPGMQLFTGSREGGRLNWNAIYDLKSGNRFARNNAAPVAHRVGTGYYSFHCPVLGLISCSRFTEQGEESTAFDVTAAPLEEGAAFLLFHNSNSIVEGSFSVDVAHFDSVPAGEPVTVLLTKRSGGKLFLSVKWGIVGSRGLEQPEFIIVTAKELLEKLRALERKSATHSVARLFSPSRASLL
ncbi:hypothetical protein EPD60_08185 [Flaviaesturariibacter flavus]|uniref:Uncharacterized protein n=1 Tax=Flaviaesturariibacter flavus TaxID=2502780 RepID=A0A4R1BAL3_9BACT|nr:hypothetical protein [Flaviaesturariibacter flavus]TCJ13984.1 hypothetical protein EPD60_08185 [Flaviaesturariibacter flavus]